jgi:hypothetical protein
MEYWSDGMGSAKPKNVEELKRAEVKGKRPTPKVFGAVRWQAPNEKAKSEERRQDNRTTGQRDNGPEDQLSRGQGAGSREQGAN